MDTSAPPPEVAAPVGHVCELPTTEGQAYHAKYTCPTCGTLRVFHDGAWLVF